MNSEREFPPKETEVTQAGQPGNRGEQDSAAATERAKRRRMAWTAGIAAAAVAGMTGLAFAAVPLYDAFCRVTGYGGTTQEATSAPSRVLDRSIQVRFDSNIAPGVPIEFAPKQATETLRIGETGLAFYRIRNTSDEPITVRATYNVAPHIAGQYFAKLECFCFQDRVLAAGEEAELPVVFFVDPDIVSDPETRSLGAVTLSYTYFRSTAQQAPGSDGSS